MHTRPTYSVTQRIVTLDYCALYKYSYLLTYSFCFICGFTDRLYVSGFYLFISLNDSVPSRAAHFGPGNCYEHHHSPYMPSNGVSTANCSSSQRRPDYLLIVGRYVTVMPYTGPYWGLIWSICEVTVIGVRQDIDADGN